MNQLREILRMRPFLLAEESLEQQGGLYFIVPSVSITAWKSWCGLQISNQSPVGLGEKGKASWCLPLPSSSVSPIPSLSVRKTLT